MRWVRRGARRLVKSLYEDYPSVGSDTETSGPPNSEERAAGSERQRERWTRSTSQLVKRNRFTELVLVQQEEALINLNPEINVDPISSETEPSIAQQINMISEPETPAPVTPTPRGRILSKRRPFSVTSLRATRQNARYQVTQEAVSFAISPTTGDTSPAKRTRSKQPTYRRQSILTSDITSDNAVTALLKSPETSLIPTLTPSGHSTTIVLAENNTLARSVSRKLEGGTGTLGLINDLTTNNTNDYVFLLGDFNLYYPAWGGENAARDTLSNQLLDLNDRRYLDLWLEPGITTRDEAGAKTTINLVLGSHDLTPRLVACEVNERVHADSDHYPIRTLLDISTKTPEAQLRRNWKACSVKDLQSFVDLNLQKYLIETVNQGIAASTPWAKPSKWANPSFKAECREMIKITRKFRQTAEQKVEAFRKAFFLEPPPADLSDISTARISPQIDFPDLTEYEVLRCIRRAPPDKVSGPDGIPNKVWHWLDKVSSFLALLTQIFNAYLRLGHNPEYFQQSTTVMLHKTASRDYRLAKSYRPIALLNTLSKILEAVATVRIAWALEERNLLLRSHLGGRRGISVDHLIQLLLDQIFESWGKGRKFPGYLSNLIPTPTGIPQGSPISPILFFLFNTPLIRALLIDGIEALRIHPPLLEGDKTVPYGWIDDVATLAISDSYAVNQRLLKRALDKAAVWSRQHSSKFAPDKFELIHFKNPLRPDPAVERPVPQEYIYTEPWQGEDPEVDNWDPPVEYAKYLGIWLDRTLSFDTHRAKALAKANRTLEALRSISGSTWGTSLLNMRRIYLAVVVPQLLYRAAAWYSPTSQTVNYKKLQKTVNEFQKIQTRAAILISGVFRNTASAALEVELYLPPIRIQMQQAIQETAIRIQTGPAMACPRGLRWERLKEELPLRCIIEGAEEAVQTHDRVCREDRQIWYTDGSSYQGMIGAAAVSIRAGKTARKYLGTELDSTVYVGELEGTRMALDQAKPIPITVFSDSQAAIQAVRNPGRPSGQYALRAIYERIRTLRSEGLEDAELRWIPAHIGEDDEEAPEPTNLLEGLELGEEDDGYMEL
ncbi:uncharacterized protein KD926_002131 [Aspergillus affinis]|uniref:uncharacterized protein n=1 Tax=Aspergillus affinis TaxID=1070780 RepID=UPI0022FDF5A5|nr:uncharacterized protein KD926_002131 [Aspergillus affinis]KAI9036266.1 hypothetical protein KD926_002131 [Aspergillus affinis]